MLHRPAAPWRAKLMLLGRSVDTGWQRVPCRSSWGAIQHQHHKKAIADCQALQDVQEKIVIVSEAETQSIQHDATWYSEHAVIIFYFDPRRIWANLYWPKMPDPQSSCQTHRRFEISVGWPAGGHSPDLHLFSLVLVQIDTNLELLSSHPWFLPLPAAAVSLFRLWSSTGFCPNSCDRWFVLLVYRSCFFCFSKCVEIIAMKRCWVSFAPALKFRW